MYVMQQVLQKNSLVGGTPEPLVAEWCKWGRSERVKEKHTGRLNRVFLTETGISKPVPKRRKQYSSAERCMDQRCP